MAEENHCGCSNHDPFANLDEETREKIQEMQFLEQNFQQLLMQKNAFSLEINDTDLILKEVEKADGEISKIVGGQVIIKTSKAKIIEEMKHKKQLLESRMKTLDEQEQEFSEKLESLRAEVIAKING